MKPMLLHFVCLVIGAVSWTFIEYWLHRKLGHVKARNPFTVEHLAHHRDPMYFAPTWKKGVAALVVYSLATPVLVVLLGAGAYTLMAGFLLMYGAYELVHRRLHTHGPKSAYGRWARRHHLHHHFRRPSQNHGVTSPLWDWVFRTLEVPRVVNIPKRRLLPWMLDGDGELKSCYRRDFATR